MQDSTRGEVLWRPPADARRTTATGQFLDFVSNKTGLAFPDYHALWEWSVTDLDGFWEALWERFSVPASTPYERVRGHADGTGRDLPRPIWFPGARLNYATAALHPHGVAPDDTAVIARSQTVGNRALTWAALRDQVARARAGLAALGVREGDRVAAYLPNGIEALVALLATASLGAIWSSCPPEFGARSVTDRFRQIEPRVLIACSGYRYGARDIDRREALNDIRAALPSLHATVHVPYLHPAPQTDPTNITWDALLAHAPDRSPAVPVAFDHPLYVLYSSGTTGLPKAIVHGHGGILLEHLKALGLHADLGPGAHFFWYSTTGWMMWNLLVSGLLVGATIVLFDGDPAWPDLDALWSLAEETGTTTFGVSAPFLHACTKEGLQPGRIHDLSKLRAVGSTGAPLSVDGFRWVYEAVRDDIPVASISGGTDVCTAFLGHDPLLPVRAGELSGPYLGVHVEALGPDGAVLSGVQGELVVRTPMPSMPVAFWGDDDGTRLESAYFRTYPGCWHHGDWVTTYPDGACVISGRSDATLNRGGVRLGTADFYRVVDAIQEVNDSLIVYLDDPDGGLGRLLLFLRLNDDAALDDALRARITAELRRQLSPRHAPDELYAVPAIPRTLSGKRLEVPVKRILTGTPAASAASRESLADPASLDWFVAWAHEHG